jgi:protein-S-isoprenylcysteine O-methyltransferase Ste14
MLQDAQAAALFIVAAGALLRGCSVIALAFRTFSQRARFASFQVDRGFIMTAPEPFLLTGAAALLAARGTAASANTALAAAVAGAVLVVAGWAIVVWTIASWPSIFVGHALLRDHRLVTTGAYAHLRNPVYAGAFLIWLGLGVGYASAWVIGLTFAYVIPAYIVYMRDEETMLERAFGEEYRRYRASVPRLIPRLFGARITKNSPPVGRAPVAP